MLLLILLSICASVCQEPSIQWKIVVVELCATQHSKRFLAFETSDVSFHLGFLICLSKLQVPRHLVFPSNNYSPDSSTSKKKLKLASSLVLEWTTITSKMPQKLYKIINRDEPIHHTKRKESTQVIMDFSMSRNVIWWGAALSSCLPQVISYLSEMDLQASS